MSDIFLSRKGHSLDIDLFLAFIIFVVVVIALMDKKYNGTLYVSFIRKNNGECVKTLKELI